MGGIVAAELLIGLATEKPIYTEDGVQKPDRPSFNAFMFPYIQGVLAFDTPYLGISPGVVAHGAEDQYANVSQAASAFTQLSGLGASIWGANKAASPAPRTAAALPAPPAASGGVGWQKWGKMAMYAGAVGAVAAGGAAAWMNREQLGESWSWATSHLEFVGCLARGEELRKRVLYLLQLREDLNIGFANLYTRLGKSAPAKQTNVVGTVLGPNRTFCNLPKKPPVGVWKEAVNDKVRDEIGAHMSKFSLPAGVRGNWLMTRVEMFTPEENPGYDRLVQDAAEYVHGWLQNEWYESSVEERPMLEQAPSSSEGTSQVQEDAAAAPPA